MNVRLTIALVLIVFMIPVGHIYFSLPIEPAEVGQAAQMLGFLSYVVLIAYLIATGYNLQNKGRPW